MDIFALLIGLGYLGIFAASALANATIIFPVPAFLAVFLAGAALNPLALGIAAGLGGAVGELTGYGVGFGAEKLLLARQDKKIERRLLRLEKAFEKYKGWLVIFAAAALPLPFDIVGLFCGSIAYDIKKFFVACAAGKMAKYTALAYAGFYSLSWLFII